MERDGKNKYAASAISSLLLLLQESHVKCEWVETSHRRIARKPETGRSEKLTVESTTRINILHARCRLSLIGTSRIHTLGLVADAPRVFDQHTSFWVIIRHKIKLSLLFHLVQLKVLQVNPSDPVKSK